MKAWICSLAAAAALGVSGWAAQAEAGGYIYNAPRAYGYGAHERYGEIGPIERHRRVAYPGRNYFRPLNTGHYYYRPDRTADAVFVPRLPRYEPGGNHYYGSRP